MLIMFANETNLAITLVSFPCTCNAMLQIFNFMGAETPVWSSDQYYFFQNGRLNIYQVKLDS